MERLMSQTFRLYDGQDLYRTQGEVTVTSVRRRRTSSSSSSSSSSIMKTLCFSLLLLSVCCCDAMPEALRFSTAPGNCCFNFNTRSLPLKLVSDVSKTHSSCLRPAFIVQTVRGRQVCYSQTSQWAVDVYHRLHSPAGSRQQQ